MPTNLMATDVLKNLTFGGRIAEEEREQLAKYFVETDQWRQVRNGSVDVGAFGGHDTYSPKVYSVYPRLVF